MFDIGWSELVVIGVVALIAIGPKELPGVLRTVGQYMGKVRRMAAEFQGQFQEAMREAEMADLKKQVDDIADTAKGFTSGLADFDPMESVKKEIDSVTAGVSETGSATPLPAETTASDPAAHDAATASAPVLPVSSEPVAPPSEPAPTTAVTEGSQPQEQTTHHAKPENAA